MEIESYLNKKYEFKFNEILNRTYYLRKKSKTKKFKLLKEYRLNSIYRELINNGVSASLQRLKSLLKSDFVEKYNPFTDYFDALPVWDGKVDFISELADTVDTTNNELFQWAFKKWLVALVACATIDEVANHSVLILTGKQGSGKTTWVLNLLPKEIFSEYTFSGKINPGSRDSTIQLSERILINMDELASYTKNQIDSFKELITKDKISERLAYGTFTENYVRRASFVGSANHNEILMDVTGNRRFLVFEALEIDYKHNVDLDKVYSQAKTLLDQGFKHYFDSKDISRIEENNKLYKQSNIEEEYIDKYFKLPSATFGEQVEYKNATEVVEYLKIRISTYVNLSPIQIGKLLKSLGYETKKVNGINKYKLILK